MIQPVLKLLGVLLIVGGLFGIFRFAGSFTIVATDVPKGSAWFGITCPSGVELSPTHFIASKGSVIYDIDYIAHAQTCTFSRREECPSDQTAWIKAAPGTYTGYTSGCQKAGTVLTVTTTVYPSGGITTSSTVPSTTSPVEATLSAALPSILMLAGGLVLFFVGG